MTETLRYTQLGKQDIRFGDGTFPVTLADGSVVTLNEVNVNTEANALTTGKLAFFASDWQTTTYYADFVTAVSSIGSTAGTLLIPRSVAVGSATTVPSTLHTKLIGQGMLTGSVTVTFNGPFEAPLKQVFGSGLTVVFGSGVIPTVYPEWWGAKGDGSTTDTTAIISARTAADSGDLGLTFQPGRTYLTSNLSFTNSESPAFVVGGFNTVLKAVSGTTGNFITLENIQSIREYFRFANFIIDSNDNAGVGFYIHGSRNLSVQDVEVINSTGYGIHIDGASGFGNYYSNYINVRSGRTFGIANAGGGWKIVSTGGQNFINANTFVNCKSLYNQGDGYTLDLSQNTYVGCEAEENDGYGWNIDNCFSNTFHGGYSEHNHQNFGTADVTDGTDDESFNLTANSAGVMIFGGRHIGKVSGTTSTSANFLLRSGGTTAPRLNDEGQMSLLGLMLRRATPSQLTGDVNDYDPGDNTFLRLSSDASRTITGFAITSSSNDDGRLLLLRNVGSNDIVLARENAGSSATHRIETGTGGNITLSALDTALLAYDTSTGRWFVFNTH